MVGLPSLTALQKQQSDLYDAAQAIVDQAEEEERDCTEEEQSDFDGIMEEAKALDEPIKKAQSRMDWINRRVALRDKKPSDQPKPVYSVPRGQRPKNFQGEVDGRTAHERAYRFGMFALALASRQMPTHYQFPTAINFCTDQLGVDYFNVASTTDNANAGVFVPEEFGQDLIDLREQFGVFRRFAKVVPMMSDTRTDPRRVSGLTAYFVGENDAGTESDASWDQVRLTARKLMVLSRMSNELSMDSVVIIGDTLAGEISYAFATKEDDCGFNGDGTQTTYGGIEGVLTKMNNDLTAGTAPGLILGAGNLWSELTLANFESVVGGLPIYADTPNARWYCHKTFYHTVMVRLMLASGGVPGMEVASGIRTPEFLGYPVTFSQIFPSSEENSQIPVILGDLMLAASFGDRQMETIAFSDQASVGGQSMWERDQIGIKGTERFDINVHDIGTDTAAGPVVGLETASS